MRQSFCFLLTVSYLFVKNLATPCLDISTRTRPCKEVFSVYFMLITDGDDQDSSNGYLKLIKPILEPCIHSEQNATQETQSIIRFPVTPTIVMDDCQFFSFPQVDSLDEWSASSVLHVEDDSDENNDNLIEWLNKTKGIREDCDQQTKPGRVPIFFILMDIESSIANKKFSNLSTHLEADFYNSFKSDGIVAKVFWTKEGNKKLDENIEKFMQKAKNLSEGYVDSIVDNLADPKRASHQYGMCFPSQRGNGTEEDQLEDSSPKQVKNVKKWMLLLIGIILCLLSIVLCFVFCIVYRRRVLKRPVHFSSAYLQRRPDPNAPPYEGENDYVPERVIFRISERSRTSNEQGGQGEVIQREF